MAIPETDLEYLMNGEPGFVEARLWRLGMLSQHGVVHADEVRALIAAAKARYNPDDTGPSYVHALTKELIDRGLLSESALGLHRRGKRGYLDRWGDTRFMAWIGENPPNE